MSTSSLWLKTQSGYVAVEHVVAVERKSYVRSGEFAVVAMLAVTAGEGDQGFEPEYRRLATCAKQDDAQDLAQRVAWAIVRRQASGASGFLSIDKGGEVVFDRAPVD